MRHFSSKLDLFQHSRLNWGGVILTLICVGTVFAAIDSWAQAVPPRVQSLMITRPIVPPPIPPLQKDVGQVRQEVKDTKAEFARQRRIEAERTVIYVSQRVKELEEALRCFEKCVPENGKICGEYIPAQIKNDRELLRNYCNQRRDAIEQDIKALQSGVGK